MKKDIWDLLVQYAGAAESERQQFYDCVDAESAPSRLEYRFRGWFGMSGKIWRRDNYGEAVWYVTAHSPSEAGNTPDLGWLLKWLNYRIDLMQNGMLDPTYHIEMGFDKVPAGIKARWDHNKEEVQ